MLIKSILLIILLISAPTIALDYFQPPAVYTASPTQTFKHQKSWFYYSKNTNSYIVQAFLPDFNKDDITIKISKRLVDGYQLSISASKWYEVKHKYHPSKKLLTFSQTVNLPPSNINSLEQSYSDNILTITISPLQPPVNFMPH